MNTKQLKEFFAEWQRAKVDSHYPTITFEESDMLEAAFSALTDRLEAAEKLAEFRLKTINSMDALVAGRNNRISELESWVRGVEEAMISATDHAAAAGRERDELRAEQAEHDEQIARMESKFSLAKRALDSKNARCEKAETELRRRDAAAGEPVGLQCMGDSGKWQDCSSREAAESLGFTLFRELYTAAPPAVLPPEMETPSAKMTYTRGHADGWNDCRSAMMALGAQQQKVVELPDHKFRECVNGLLEEAIAYAGTQQLRARLSSRLSNFVKTQRATGVKWEVKK